MNTQRVNNFIKAKLIENQTKIKSVAEEYLDDLQRRIVNATSAGMSFKGLTEEVSKQYGISLGRAKTLARTETSKISAAATEARCRDLDISAYIWRCAFLPTSRDSHEEMEGMIVDYDNPPTLDGLTGHAGELPNCYCWENPVILKEGEDSTLDYDDDEGDRGEDGSISSRAMEAVDRESVYVN